MNCKMMKIHLLNIFIPFAFNFYLNYLYFYSTFGMKNETEHRFK